MSPPHHLATPSPCHLVTSPRLDHSPSIIDHSPRPTPLLSITDLVVRYGAIEALHGVSLHVDPAQIVCLIGANGAGKSSLLRAISGLIPVHSGTITYTPPEMWCGHWGGAARAQHRQRKPLRPTERPP